MAYHLTLISVDKVIFMQEIHPYIIAEVMIKAVKGILEWDTPGFKT